MNDIVIKAENLSKRYYMGEHRAPYRTLRDTLASFLNSRGRKLSRQHIWALKDVSFEIRKGEVFGIIGNNGAGKTTLLKILSGITVPTAGIVKIKGRAATLLEVGTGFHPELTGRENIYLNGAILGMKKREINKKFDEIVSFAEVEQFIDTPVKFYSSGMYVRLAFSVAAHLEPEILLVDEVLAVGDFAFQKKCLGKMGDVAGKGRTVLFVSHNLTAIRNLCKRSILLNKGSVVLDSTTIDVLDKYLSTSAHYPGNILDASRISRPENHGIKLKITEAKILSAQEYARIPVGAPFEVEVRVEVREPLRNISVGLGIFSLDEIKLLGSNSGFDQGPYPKFDPGTYIVRAKLNHFYLKPGKYLLDIDVRNEKQRLDYLPKFFLFEVVETRRDESNWFKTKEGFFITKFDWEIRRF